MKCPELLAELVDRQRHSGQSPIFVSCAPGEESTPYAAVRQVLAGLAGDPASPDHGTVERLRHRLLHAPAPPDHRVFEEVHASLLEVLRRSPKVIVVDRVQWMDDASLRWFAYLVRHLAPLPLLVVLGVRTDDHFPAREVLDEITAQAFCRELVLGPISLDSVRAVVARSFRQSAIDERFVTLCQKATGGVPQILDRVLQALLNHRLPPEAATPEQVEQILRVCARIEADSVASRLARQSARLRELAEAVSVLGRAAEPPIVADLLNTAPEEVEGMRPELARIDVLDDAPRGACLTVRTPEIRSAVLHSLSERRRQLLHLRAARRLGDYGAPTTRVADHLLPLDLSTLSPGVRRWALRTLQQAAEEALTGGHTRPCAEYARRALREEVTDEQRARLLCLLGRSEALHAPRAAARHLDEAISLLIRPEERAEAVLELWYAQMVQHGAFAESVLRLPSGLPPRHRELLDAADTTDTDLRTRIRALARSSPSDAELIPQPSLGAPPGLSEATGTRAVLESFGALLPAGLGVPGVTPAERELLAACAGDLACRAESRETALELASRALAGTAGCGAPSIIMLLRCTAVLSWAGTLDAATSLADTLASCDVPVRSVPQVIAHCLRADIAVRRGDLATAFQEAHAAQSLAQATESEDLSLLPLALKARAHAVSGRYEQALRLLEGVADMPASMLGVRGWCRLSLGDTKSALIDLLECGRRLTELHIVNPALSAWRGGAALALTELGENALARQLLDEELELARRWGDCGTIGQSLRAAARITTTASARVALLEESVRVLEGSGARLQLARSRVSLGRAFAAGGRLLPAREALRAGISLAEECGAKLLVERAHKDLLGCGGRMRRSPLSGPASLTRSERRIAALAATGQTNRTIAQALQVAPGTVEVHLTRAYRKLGVSGRNALADALAGVLVGEHEPC
ncbi:hypothetical protein GCM10010442_33880 [Kitasatospora kifunensis]